MASLVTLADFALRLPGGVSAAENPRATAMLEDASAIVLAEGDSDWTDATAPDVVKAVVFSAARRAFLNPDGIRAESLDINYSTTFSDASPDVYLTRAELRLVRRASGRLGVWAQSTTRGGPDVPVVSEDAAGDTTHVLGE